MPKSYVVRFPHEVASELLSRIAKPKAGANLAGPVPPPDALRAILDISYAASLVEEERRPVVFSVTFVEPARARTPGASVLLFRAPLPFDPDRLAKVALATEPSRTAFCVWPSAAGGLEIWGLVHRGDGRYDIDREHRPTHFSLRVLRPGTFTVNFNERLILLFSRDHWHLFDHPLDLLGTLRTRACVPPAVARDLYRLAKRMLAHGHGGTILVTDSAGPMTGLIQKETLSIDVGSHELLRDKPALDEAAMTGSAPGAGRALQRALEIEHRRRSVAASHHDALDFVANLTAIDGAVVLGEDLRLLSFGATIATPIESAPQSVLQEDPRAPGTCHQVPLRNLGGNRHRSAACFCAQQPGLALALVASQDGDLSLFTRHPDGVVQCFRPYEFGVGL